MIRTDAPHLGVRQLADLIRSCCGERWVLATGCFDLIHPGHCHLLREAALHGDRLIVALNSDNRIRELKGPSRPINSLADRLAVVASLRAVDFVTSFEESTAAELLGDMRPNVWVKGSDWAGLSLPELSVCGQHKISVVFVELLPGYSTSKLEAQRA